MTIHSKHGFTMQSVRQPATFWTPLKKATNPSFGLWRHLVPSYPWNVHLHFPRRHSYSTSSNEGKFKTFVFSRSGKNKIFTTKVKAFVLGFLIGRTFGMFGNNSPPIKFSVTQAPDVGEGVHETVPTKDF